MSIAIDVVADKLVFLNEANEVVSTNGIKNYRQTDEGFEVETTLYGVDFLENTKITKVQLIDTDKVVLYESNVEINITGKNNTNTIQDIDYKLVVGYDKAYINKINKEVTDTWYLRFFKIPELKYILGIDNMEYLPIDINNLENYLRKIQSEYNIFKDFPIVDNSLSYPPEIKDPKFYGLILPVVKGVTLSELNRELLNEPQDLTVTIELADSNKRMETIKVKLVDFVEEFKKLNISVEKYDTNSKKITLKYENLNLDTEIYINIKQDDKVISYSGKRTFEIANGTYEAKLSSVDVSKPISVVIFCTRVENGDNTPVRTFDNLTIPAEA